MKRAFDEVQIESSSEDEIQDDDITTYEVDLSEAILFDEAQHDLPINERNKHPRDDLITFDPVPHTYTLEDGHVFKYSVTSLLSIVEYPFPVNMIINNMHFAPQGSEKPWEAKYRKADSKYNEMTRYDVMMKWCVIPQENGTYMHNCIDEYYNASHRGSFLKATARDIKNFFLKNTSFDRQDLLRYVDAFCLADLYLRNNGWKVYRTEWRIYSKKLDIAGSVDAVFRKMCPDRTYKYLLVDWKCSDKEYTEQNYPKFLQEPWGHVQNTKLNCYGGQLGNYEFIFQEEYGIKFEKRMLFQLQPNGHMEKHIIKPNMANTRALFLTYSKYRTYINVMSTPKLARKYLKFPEVTTFAYQPNV
jgi:hypothetical protein